MKRIVWTFGLIAGGIMAVMMAITLRFEGQIGVNGYVIGYTTMIVAFLMVYFGIRRYRDTVLTGGIRFGQAFKVGILITLLASTCYVATWEAIYYVVAPDFAQKFAAREIEKRRTSGATEAEIAAEQQKMAGFVESYHNPVVNVAYTYLEVFPVGLVVVLVSAGILSRRRSNSTAEPARA